MALAAADLQRTTPELAGSEVVVEDVPRLTGRVQRVPLGRVIRQTGTTQLVVHRRAVLAAGGGEDLIRDVLTELAADILLTAPEDLDRRYPRAP